MMMMMKLLLMLRFLFSAFCGPPLEKCLKMTTAGAGSDARHLVFLRCSWSDNHPTSGAMGMCAPRCWDLSNNTDQRLVRVEYPQLSCMMMNLVDDL
jgi:hypothetical protein